MIRSRGESRLKPVPYRSHPCVFFVSDFHFGFRFEFRSSTHFCAHTQCFERRLWSFVTSAVDARRSGKRIQRLLDVFRPSQDHNLPARCAPFNSPLSPPVNPLPYSCAFSLYTHRRRRRLTVFPSPFALGSFTLLARGRVQNAVGKNNRLAKGDSDGDRKLQIQEELNEIHN